MSLSERAPKNSAGLPGGRVHVFASIIEEIELFQGDIQVTAWNESPGRRIGYRESDRSMARRALSEENRLAADGVGDKPDRMSNARTFGYLKTSPEN